MVECVAWWSKRIESDGSATKWLRWRKTAKRNQFYSAIGSGGLDGLGGGHLPGSGAAPRAGKLYSGLAWPGQQFLQQICRTRARSCQGQGAALVNWDRAAIPAGQPSVLPRIAWFHGFCHLLSQCCDLNYSFLNTSRCGCIIWLWPSTRENIFFLSFRQCKMQTIHNYNGKKVRQFINSDSNQHSTHCTHTV